MIRLVEDETLARDPVSIDVCHRGRKLVPADVREIRGLLADGLPASTIGQRFGVSALSIRKIRNGQTWADVPA